MDNLVDVVTFYRLACGFHKYGNQFVVAHSPKPAYLEPLEVSPCHIATDTYCSFDYPYVLKYLNYLKEAAEHEALEAPTVQTAIAFYSGLTGKTYGELLNEFLYKQAKKPFMKSVHKASEVFADYLTGGNHNSNITKSVYSKPFPAKVKAKNTIFNWRKESHRVICKYCGYLSMKRSVKCPGCMRGGVTQVNVYPLGINEFRNDS